MSERINLTLFIPESCTVGQLLDILYWPKSCGDLVEYEIDGVRGARVEVLAKPEYLDELKRAVSEAGASILDG